MNHVRHRAYRYNLPVRDLPRGKTQRMRLPMQSRAADPSGARGKAGMETLRVKALELMSAAKAATHKGVCHLLLEVHPQRQQQQHSPSPPSLSFKCGSAADMCQLLWLCTCLSACFCIL